MPAALSHYFHSLEVLKRLNYKKINKEALVYGGQGPDFLYFHRLSPFQIGKSYRKVGNMLHKTDPDKTLSAMAEYLIHHPEDVAALSYALGFICHYSFDRTAHPYVYYTEKAIIASEKIKYNRLLVHCRIEHSLDVILLRKYLGLDSSQFNPAKILTDDAAMLLAQGKLIEYTVNTLYGDNSITEGVILKAFKDYKRNLTHLHDPFTIKRPLLNVLEKVLHIGPAVSCVIRPLMEDGKWDYANMERGTWYNPFDPDRVSDDSFFEILEHATKDSINMIEGFLKAVENKNSKITVTEKLSFKTGLPIGASADE